MVRRRGWTTPLHPALRKERERVFPSLPAFICTVLAQGRKFTAKSERDVICGKTLLFFHEVISSPWVEWLAATKGLLLVRHNVPLCSTAWPHMQMTGQEGKVCPCQVPGSVGVHSLATTPAGGLTASRKEEVKTLT